MEKKTASILVIEDHAVVQLGIRTLLSTCSKVGGIDIAFTGKEAISKAKKNKFDVVLIDVELPDMTGFELLKELRKLLPTVKVMFYSMHDEFWIVRQMFQSEPDGIVMKSDHLDELRKAVEIVVEGGRYYSQEYGLFFKEYENDKALTTQELTVMQLVAQGKNTQEIANELLLSVNTVDYYRRNIMQKLEGVNMTNSTYKAFEKGYFLNNPEKNNKQN